MNTIAPRPAGLVGAWRRHWPEYLIEGWALGMFMISAGGLGALLYDPASPGFSWFEDPHVKLAVFGVAMGLTASGIIYSPWGKRSGAHMNPAVTLSFLGLGLIHRTDAINYMIAQAAGGLLGILITYPLTGGAVAVPQVNWVATVPGPDGPWIALAAELAIAFVMMFVIVNMINSRRASWTGAVAGVLVFCWVTFESPYSGFGMNPARTLASAIPSGTWTSFWIYVIAPPAGMLAAVAVYRGVIAPRRALVHPKLMPNRETRCIFTGFDPAKAPPAPESRAR
jgi:aquaporin Z